MAFHYWGEQKYGRGVINWFFKILSDGFALNLRIAEYYILKRLPDLEAVFCENIFIQISFGIKICKNKQMLIFILISLVTATP